MIAGALGAHVTGDEALTKLAETASFYQLVHAAVLLWLSAGVGPWLRLARWLCLAGIVLFCGALYLKAFALAPGATVLAPWGGTSFILAWALIAIGGWRPSP